MCWWTRWPFLPFLKSSLLEDLSANQTTDRWSFCQGVAAGKWVKTLNEPLAGASLELFFSWQLSRLQWILLQVFKLNLYLFVPLQVSLPASSMCWILTLHGLPKICAPLQTHQVWCWRMLQTHLVWSFSLLQSRRCLLIATIKSSDFNTSLWMRRWLIRTRWVTWALPEKKECLNRST